MKDLENKTTDKVSAIKNFVLSKIFTFKVQPDVADCDGPKCDDKKRDDLGRLQFSLGERQCELAHEHKNT